MAHFYVFSEANKFVGLTKHAESAAVLLSTLTEGAFIVQGLGSMNILSYVFGEDGDPSKSYDEVSHICYSRQDGGQARVLNSKEVFNLLEEAKS